MNNWFSHPAIQSSLIPLIAALVSAAVLWRWQRFYTPICVLIGYACAFIAILGVTGLAFNTTTRLALWAILVFVVGLILDLKKVKVSHVYAIVSLLTISGLIFVFWRIFKNMDVGTLVVWFAIGSIYVLVINLALISQISASIQQSTAALVLCVTTGTMALIGGSGLVMQLNFALAVAIGGLLIFLVFFPSSGNLMKYAIPATVATLAGFMAFDMVIREEDAWVLLPMALIVVSAKLFPGKWTAPWQNALWGGAVSLPGAGLALIWLWLTADTSMTY